MKTNPTRAVVNTIRRGESARNRFARWAGWFGAATTVDQRRFQGTDDPYPDHWGEPPEDWPGPLPETATADSLRAALAELPARWRRVVVLRDVERRSAEEISQAVGVTPAQQRSILNKARELLRAALARSIGQGRDS
jgi:RNA polymerase sigma-70 factor (ECF subfamily)